MTAREMIDAGATLKAKYRNSSRPHIGNHRVQHRDKIDPPEGTLTYKAGNSHSNYGGNAGVAGSNSKRSLAPRRKAYGPW